MLQSEFYGAIYLVTNILNGMRYVGQTTLYPFEKRWKIHIYDSQHKKRKNLFHRAILEFGVENFSFEIIWHCDSKISLDVSETSFIHFFDTYYPNGYNSRTGGSNGKHTEKTKQKLREKWAVPEKKAARIAARLLTINDPLIKKNFIRSIVAAHARPATKERHRAAMLRVNNEPSKKEATSRALKNSKWITNDIVNKRITGSEELPEGWRYGVLQSATEEGRRIKSEQKLAYLEKLASRE